MLIKIIDERIFLNIYTYVKLFADIYITSLKSNRPPKKTLDGARSEFKKGRSIMDHVFTIKEIINRTINRKDKLFLVIDLVKTFDTS